jgi:hypothetical protein
MGKETNVLLIAAIDLSVRQANKMTTPPETNTIIQKLFGIKPVRLSNQEAYARKRRQITTRICSKR